MAVYPATSLATQTNDAIAVTGGTIGGSTTLSVSGGTISGGSMISPTITGGSITPASGRSGTIVLNQTTPVTISSASLAITDVIVMSLNTVGGTVGVQPHVATVTSGQATIIGTASDTSTYNWALIKTA